MNKQLKADLMLGMITFFWGASYLFIRIALQDLQTFNLIALRFVIAFSLSAIIFYKNIRTADKKTIRYAFFLALFLFSIFISITFGVQYTTTSNAGFLAGMAVVLVPIFSTVFFKTKPEKKAIISVILATIGIGLLTLNEQFSINIGDLLCILCSVLYSFYLIFTDKLTKEVDSVALGVLQLGFVALFSVIFAFVIEKPTLPTSFSSWLAVIFLSIFCTAAAFIIQTTALKHTTSLHAGLIFSLGPVIAAVIGRIFLAEVLTLRGYIGAILMLIGILIIEIDMDRIIRKYMNTKKEVEQ